MESNAGSRIAQKKLTDANANIRAVTYARMSTEHQRYSIENQSAAIERYAKSHNMKVVRTYADAGKSGLNISGRDGLKRLLMDVEGANRDFDVVLVYDISRWGRFQDADEAAFYEYQCKRAGVAIHYCAEQFDNDGSPVSTIVKGVKRAMAGEYSRELSTRVFAAQCRLIEKGFRQGGAAVFGLRRVLIDEFGNRKQVLKLHEQKSLTTDRVILEPGPESEVRVVNRIFEDFVLRRKNISEIADRLNAEGIKTSFGNDWSRKAVTYLLQNEAYVGHNVFNRKSTKLRQRTVRNPPDMWIRAENVFEAIVPDGLFHAAQAIFKERTRGLTDDELLMRLTQHYRLHGCLSLTTLEEAENLPCTRTIAKRFGGLLRAYSLVGFKPDNDFKYLETRKRLHSVHRKAVDRLVAGVEELGATASFDPATQFLIINCEFTVSVSVVKHVTTNAGASRWTIRFDPEKRPDVTVAVRMNEANEAARDYYFLPSMEFRATKIRLAERNKIRYDAFRFDSLSTLFEMARRQRIYEAA